MTEQMTAIGNFYKFQLDLGIFKPAAAKLIDAALSYGKHSCSDELEEVSINDFCKTASSIYTCVDTMRYVDSNQSGSFGLKIIYDSVKGFDVFSLRKTVSGLLDELLKVYKKLNLETLSMYSGNETEEKALDKMIAYQVRWPSANLSKLLLLKSWLIDPDYAKDKWPELTKETIGEQMDPFKYEIYNTLLTKRDSIAEKYNARALNIAYRFAAERDDTECNEMADSLKRLRDNIMRLLDTDDMQTMQIILQETENIA